MVITLSVFESVILYLVVFSISSSMIKVRTNTWFRVILVAFLPTILAGMRYYVGSDYGSYLWGFELIKDESWIDIFEDYQFLDDPIAFKILEKLISYTGSNFLFFAVTAALSYIPVILYVIKNLDEENDEYNIASRTLFLYLLWYFTFGLAAIKQGIALAFCLYSLTYVYNSKPIKFLLTVILASLFHPSAITFVAVYFLWSSSGEVKLWKKIITVVACGILIIGFDYFVETYGGTYSDYAGQEVYGRNMTFWIMLAWLIIFLLYRKNFLFYDMRNDLLIILFAMGTMLQLLGFTNAFTKRIGEYFLVTRCILLPQLPCVFTEESQRIGWALIILFNIFLFIMQYISTSSILPYQLIFW